MALVPGFTQIPDCIIDYWMSELSGAEFKVIMFLCRRTYGWGKESDSASIGQFCDGIVKADRTRANAGTGLSRKSVMDALEHLKELGLIASTSVYDKKTKQHKPTTYTLDIYFPGWGGGLKISLGVGEKLAEGVGEKLAPQYTSTSQETNIQDTSFIQRPILEPEQEAPSRPEAVLEQEGSKKEEPADLPEDSSQFCLTNIGDWVDTISHEAIGQHLRARLVTGEREGLLALIESEGKESVARRLAEFFLDGGKSVEKFLNPPGVKQAKSKSARAPAPQQQRISRNSASVTQRGRPGYSTQPSAPNAQKQESGHTPETAAAVSRWNELVPAKAVTLTGSVKGYSVDLLKGLCQDEEFMQGFDTICKKAAAQGPWCNFGWLPFDKQDGKGPNWGKLLRGELDGLGSAGGGFKTNKFSRDSLRATAEADIARRAQL